MFLAVTELLSTITILLIECPWLQGSPHLASSSAEMRSLLFCCPVVHVVNILTPIIMDVKLCGIMCLIFIHLMANNMK